MALFTADPQKAIKEENRIKQSKPCKCCAGVSA